MGFREVSVFEIREVLRAWLGGAGLRTAAERAGVDRKTARRYVLAAEAAGLDRAAGIEAVTDVLVGAVVAAVRPVRPNGHGPAWDALLPFEEQIRVWLVGTPEPPARLLSRWQECAGQIDGISVRWIASGAVYLYLAVPAWKQELEEHSENWSEERDAQRTDLYRAVRIRMTHLAEQLEREPEYRGGTTHSRGSIGKTLLELKLQSNEDGYMVTLVLKERRAASSATTHRPNIQS